MLIVHSHPSTSQAQNAGRCCPLATNLEYAPRRITQTTALTIGKWKNTGRIDGRAGTASATSPPPFHSPYRPIRKFLQYIEICGITYLHTNAI